MDDPPEVWDAMRAEEKVEFLTPLTIAAVRDSFRDEFGSEVQLEMNDDGLSLIGPGWEAFHVDGASHLYIMCSWALPKDQVALTKLVRAGMRGGCFVFDPQSQDWWHPPSKQDLDSFRLWDTFRSRED